MVNVHALMTCGVAGAGPVSACGRCVTACVDRRGISTRTKQDEQTEGEMVLKTVARSVWTVVVYRLRTGWGGL